MQVFIIHSRNSMQYIQMLLKFFMGKSCIINMSLFSGKIHNFLCVDRVYIAARFSRCVITSKIRIKSKHCSKWIVHRVFFARVVTRDVPMVTVCGGCLIHYGYQSKQWQGCCGFYKQSCVYILTPHSTHRKIPSVRKPLIQTSDRYHDDWKSARASLIM